MEKLALLLPAMMLIIYIILCMLVLPKGGAGSTSNVAVLMPRPSSALRLGGGDWPANATPPFPPSWRTNDSTLLYWRNGTGFVSDETLGRNGMFIWDWAHRAKR